MMRPFVLFLFLAFLFSCHRSPDPEQKRSEPANQSGSGIAMSEQEKLEARKRFDKLIQPNYNDYDSMLANQNEALSIAHKLNDDSLVARVYMNVGGYFDGIGEYSTMAEYYFKVLETYQKLKYNRGAIVAFNNLAWGYTQAKDYNKAIELCREGIALLNKIETGRDTVRIAIALYNNLAIAFLENGSPDSALKYNEIAYNLFSEMKVNDLYLYSWLNTTFGCIYDNKKDSRKAQEYFNRLLGNIDSASIADASIYGIGRYCHFLNRMGRYGDVVSIGKEGIRIAQSSRLKRYQINIAEELQFAYEKLRNIDSAYVYIKMAKGLNDSIFNERKSIQLQALSFNRDIKAKEIQHEIENANAAANLKSEQQLRNIFLAGFVLVILFAGLFLFQRNKIRAGKVRSDELLLNILPAEVAEELKQKGSTTAKQFDHVTVMFTDFKNFSQIAEKLSPEELVSEIHYCFKAFDHIIEKYPIEKIKTIGDSYMCAGGLPVSNTTHAFDVVSAAIEIQHFIGEHLKQRASEGKELFEIRIGIHTGPVVAGIVGVKKFAYDIWGDTVNTASRMESSGEAAKVNISGTTYALVKDRFHCTYRGKIQAKNKGELDMYFVSRSFSVG